MAAPGTRRAARRATEGRRDRRIAAPTSWRRVGRTQRSARARCLARRCWRASFGRSGFEDVPRPELSLQEVPVVGRAAEDRGQVGIVAHQPGLKLGLDDDDYELAPADAQHSLGDVLTDLRRPQETVPVLVPLLVQDYYGVRVGALERAQDLVRSVVDGGVTTPRRLYVNIRVEVEFPAARGSDETDPCSEILEGPAPCRIGEAGR